MPAYFVESSAAVKLYVRERGSRWLLSLTDPAQGNQFFLVRIAAVEITAALYRRVRGATLTTTQAANAVTTLRGDLSRIFEVVEVSAVLSDTAMIIAERHGLRGYDCMQLAAAQLTQQARQIAGLSPVTLLSADRELNAAAQTDGLAVDDPNNHP